MKVETKVHFQSAVESKKQMQVGPKRVVPHRVPRVAKLMALALRFERLIQDGVVANYAELARLGYVTRARVSQLMRLLNLAPDIIEAILFLEPVKRGKDRITEKSLRPLLGILDWKLQRLLWQMMVENAKKI